jgi:hypothetical protein
MLAQSINHKDVQVCKPRASLVRLAHEIVNVWSIEVPSKHSPPGHVHQKPVWLFGPFANEKKERLMADWPLALEETPWLTIEERLKSWRVSAVSASMRSSLGMFGGTRPTESSLPLCLVFVGVSLSIDRCGCET